MNRISAALVLLVFLSGCSERAPMSTSTEYRTIERPKTFQDVVFSKDGQRIAFMVEDDSLTWAVVDGVEERRYEDVSSIHFSPRGDHCFYAGKRHGDWYLVRDGEEVVRLGNLTNMLRYTSPKTEPDKIIMSSVRWLPIWLAARAENYFVLCYQDGVGRVFKDGEWLPIEYSTFWNEGMAISPEGDHYAMALRSVGSRNGNMFIDGSAGPPGNSFQGAAYLQPGNKLTYQVAYQGRSTLMEGERPTPGYGEIFGDIEVSNRSMHVAAVVSKRDGQQAVVVDGIEESTFPRIEWDTTRSFPYPLRGSFTWNRGETSHAYVAHLDDQDGAFKAVVHDGVVLTACSDIRNWSIAISDDGTHVAYIAEIDSAASLVVDDVVQGSFEGVVGATFLGTGAEVAFLERISDRWVVHGVPGLPSYLDAGLMTAGSSGLLAYAATTDGAKVKVYVGADAVSRPFDEILSNPGIQWGETGSISFVGRDADQLVWVRVE